jgi:hypothetical protein
MISRTAIRADGLSVPMANPLRVGQRVFAAGIEVRDSGMSGLVGSESIATLSL